MEKVNMNRIQAQIKNGSASMGLFRDHLVDKFMSQYRVLSSGLQPSQVIIFT
jgi:hypothetical protein